MNNRENFAVTGLSKNYPWKTASADEKLMTPKGPENNRENLEYPIRGYRIIQELSAKNVNAPWLPAKNW